MFPKGLFAAEEIPWGITIIEYTGELVSDAVAEGRIAIGADCIFELCDDKNVDGAVKGNEARYANHARTKPNCFVLREASKIWIVAGIEGIGKGEELTFDYGSTFYSLWLLVALRPKRPHLGRHRKLNARPIAIASCRALTDRGIEPVRWTMTTPISVTAKPAI